MVKNYDVVVVGLGAMGSAATYQLARRGAHVLGIDAHHPPHTLGSSHGESRITREAVGEGAAYVPLVRRSHVIWKELEAATGETLFHRTGGSIICPKHGSAAWHGQPDFVTHSSEIATQHSIPHQQQPTEQLRVALPALKIGDDDHAYYEPGAGVLSPERCIGVQLSQAAAHGAALRYGERVTDVKPHPTSVTVKTADGTAYHAGRVVLTAGAWLNDFLPFSHQAHIKVYRQVMFWFDAADPNAFAAGVFPWVIWIGAQTSDFFAVFPTVPGGTAGVKLMTETYTHPNALPRSVTAAEADTIYNRYVARRLHGVGPGVVRAAACNYTVTTDENFMIDHHPQSDRVWFASACSGHGFKHSAAVGEALAHLTTNTPTIVDVQAFRAGRLLQDQSV